MNKVAIYTLGCKTNQLESSIIAQDFKNNGWEVVNFSSVADVYVINTCTVTAKSDNESLYLARKAKKTNPSGKVVLVGCYAQVSADEISKINEVDLIVGNKEKINILKHLVNTDGINNPEQKIIVTDIMKEDKFHTKPVEMALGRTRANLKVQDGCNNRCSYCIIPYARGKSRSDSIENVLNQAKYLVDNGYKEIVLTGIHLGQWGLDFEPKLSLLDLLEELEKVEGLKRLRLGSFDPLEINDELIDFISKSEKICEHLHISLQNTNNATLKLMNRKYSFEYVYELLNKLVFKVNNLSMGADFIVGFPEESEERFEDSYNNLQKLPLSYVHVFPYSQRKNTPAATMHNQVSDDVKKLRAERIKKLAKQKNIEFKHSLKDTVQEVLVEKSRDKRTGFLKGHTKNYVSVQIDGNDEYRNQIVKVKITDITESGVNAVIIE